jgi:cytochrome P450
MNVPGPLTLSSVPPHVAARSVVDYDVYNDHRYADVGDLHGGLHKLAEDYGYGIFWTPHNGGHWLVNDYELIFEAVRRPDIFSNSAMSIPPLQEEPVTLPLSLDPPQHGPYRMPLMKAFAPSRMQTLEADTRDHCRGLIEGIAADGHCEFVHAIAEPMPVKIFMKLVGMPLDRLDEFRGWIADLLSPEEARRLACLSQVHQLMDGLIREPELRPRDDFISQLIASDIDGRQLTYDEVQGYCLLLFTAGLDTVANSLSFGMHHVAGDAALQDRLRANPELIPEAVEESLRRFGISMPPRTATCDVDFGGVGIRQGERVMLMLPAGNLDPKVFPDPMRFDLDRENKIHLTFNSGPHRCVGSHLARMEMRIFYEEWFGRMPNVRHDPDRPSAYRPGLNLALATVPLVWDVA